MPAVPLARVKKIMKLDDEVKMISQEAPQFLAKAVELFVNELTNRAWTVTLQSKRTTVMRILYLFACVVGILTHLSQPCDLYSC